MRWDLAYGAEPQSLQMELPGLGAEGERDMAEAEEWVREHPDAWRYMVRHARRLSAMGYVSIKYLVEMVRNELHLPVKNAWTPALARIMESSHPDLKGAFHKSRSRSDGFAS